MREVSHLDLQSLRFAMYTSADIRAMSSCKVVTSLLFDQLGHALPGGLYDAAMGPYGVGADPCATCGETNQCPGHPGHTELCTPVYNPVLLKTAIDLLKFACLSCFKLQIADDVADVLGLQLRLIDAGLLVEAQDLDVHMTDVVTTASEFYTIDEKIAARQQRTDKLEKLLVETLAAGQPSVRNTKNSEALRTAVVRTAIRVKNKACVHCKTAMKPVKYSYGKLVMVVSKNEMQSFYDQQDDADKSKIRSTDKPILPDECRAYLRQIYDANVKLLPLIVPVLAHSHTSLAAADATNNTLSMAADDTDLMSAASARHAVDIFFTSAVPVTPSTVRPANKLRSQIVEHPQTAVYKAILEANATLRAIMTCMRLDDGRLPASGLASAVVESARAAYELAPGESSWEKMHDAWQALQIQVNQTWDSSAVRGSVGQGLKQGIEKKEGWIRMYTMGKRVNFAARTVITPDPYINVDEIGIPDKFAKKLSYPVPVTAWNVADLRQIVINGPDVYPGANYVENERGHMQMIPANNAVKRASMAKMLLVGSDKGVKIVHRHLVNGDVLLLNRQPSLHRPSIMAHKARVLKNEKTFRLHYSNCKSYNADFDGDEMNAHCPQNELGRSEGYHLANVSNHYLVPKDGTPLGGLIQDHVIAGVKISTRGRFFNREDYQQLVFAALGQVRGEIRTQPPAILKPTRLWSGKQIFSTILLNLTPPQLAPINLQSTAKIGARAWQVAEPRPWRAGGTPLASDSDLSEAEVWIRGGEVLCGVLDKTHYGATPYGLIHSMYELYGGEVSSQLLSSLARLFTVFLQREGFTLGVHDILVLREADRKRTKIIKRCRKIGNAVVAAALGLPEEAGATEVAAGMAEAYNKDAKFRTILDRQYKQALDGYTNSINKTCLPAGLLCKFPENNLQLMVGSGAKGSTVNTMQISCLLGQIELEGKRPPLMISGKSLPSFSVSETSPKSGGFIDGRFLTGIQPQEFFFHCMAGREGLIDTAVKTSRSGYLQRCLIKHLEGLNVNYDMTVRDSDNSVIQFMYGEDGMDIAKAPFLGAKHLAFLDDNAKTIVNDALVADLQNDSAVNEAMLRHKKALRAWVKRSSGQHRDVAARASSFQRFSSEIRDQIDLKNPEKRSKRTGRRKIDQELVKIWRAADADKKADFARKCARCPDPVFSTFKPDNHYGSISEYFEKLIATYVKARPERKREFTDMMCVKSMRSMATPGEPVGLLAAQSIGEPSTQMTLNTFHFAGRGEMNVTLGIPRLREILMMASANIKTPSMDIPFKPQAGLEQKAERLRLGLVRVTVHDVLESINVNTSIELRPTRQKLYKLRFNFLPRDSYRDDFGVRPKQVIRHMSSGFFKLMFRAIIRSVQTKNSVVDIDAETKTRGKHQANDDDQDIDNQEPTNEAGGRNGGGDSSDEEAANEEDDATAVKLKTKNADEFDYDEPEVVEEIDDAGFVSDDDDAPGPPDAAAAKGDDDDEDDVGDVNGDDVVKNNAYASNYVYDREKYLWCELTFNLPMQYNKNIDLSNILKDVARKSVISEVPLIKRAITYNQNSDLVLKTDGINIVKMFEYNDLLDINRLYTNDIHAMARTYGIEAAARVIVKEVQNVFKVYGITVDPRHLLLIADYMTFDGTFQPMSRRGMESSASPLQQMSFESSVRFLREATISGRCENLNSPSSRLMVGQPCKSGTGSFTLINNTSSEYMLRLLAD